MALSQLESMGFPTIRCQKSLLATENGDVETAMNWLLEHMDDPGGTSIPCSGSAKLKQTLIVLCRRRAHLLGLLDRSYLQIRSV